MPTPMASNGKDYAYCLTKKALTIEIIEKLVEQIKLLLLSSNNFPVSFCLEIEGNMPLCPNTFNNYSIFSLKIIFCALS